MNKLQEIFKIPDGEPVSYPVPQPTYVAPQGYPINFNNGWCCESYPSDKYMDIIKNYNTSTKTKEEPMKIMDRAFGCVPRGLCRLTIDGKIAIKTDNGYKTYDAEKNRLTNVDNFAFDFAQDFFFAIPTSKVTKGDIILIDGIPHCVIDGRDETVRALKYNGNTIVELVPEYHIFLDKQFCFTKIVCLFNGKADRLMKFMMLSNIMTNSDGGSNNMIAMMMLMNNGDNLFEGLLDGIEEKEGKK